MYSELYFTDKLWPEFSKEDLYEALIDLPKPERRFGLVMNNYLNIDDEKFGFRSILFLSCQSLFAQVQLGGESPDRGLKP